MDSWPAKDIAATCSAQMAEDVRTPWTKTMGAMARPFQKRARGQVGGFSVWSHRASSTVSPQSNRPSWEKP